MISRYCRNLRDETDMTDVPSVHKEHALKSASIFIVTCSTSKAGEKKKGMQIDDPSGDAIERLMRDAGHSIKGRALIPDQAGLLRTTIRKALKSGADAIVITGGTGMAPSDVTIEAVTPILKKEMPGFGELLRKISYETIGSAAIMSRAMAGVVNGKAIFCLPGSPDGVTTAVSKLIVPELGHVLSIARQGKT
jgi:molybdenum cofactor biosynthesis protein B